MGLLGPILPPKTYLAGGTALTLHLNHRTSFDLDLYTPNKFNEQQIVHKFEAEIPDFKFISQGWQTVIGISKDTEISLFFYQYNLLQDTLPFQSIQVASIEDIASMKLEAIAGRGLKRDFFDLYSICQLKEFSLKHIIKLAVKKYNRESCDLPHLFKSLVYFDDAQIKPERAKIVDDKWQEVKKFFVQETQKLLPEFL